jgi:hypothetical protein
MPGFDGTGPLGGGPVTGGGFGRCGGNAQRMSCRGAGLGWSRRGRRFGQGGGFSGRARMAVIENRGLSADEEGSLLQSQKDELQVEVEQLEKRREELKKSSVA